MPLHLRYIAPRRVAAAGITIRTRIPRRSILPELFRKTCRELGDEAAARFPRLDLPERFPLVLLVDPGLLTDREEVEDEVVEVQSRREAVEHERHEDRHHVDHRLLTGVFH